MSKTSGSLGSKAAIKLTPPTVSPTSSSSSSVITKYLSYGEGILLSVILLCLKDSLRDLVEFLPTLITFSPVM